MFIMKITILNDNAPGRLCLSEFGLSYFIESDKKILFDAGATDVFLQNAKRLNVSLDDIDLIVLSHGHWDHGNGLKYLSNHKLICHPQCFTDRYNKKDDSYVGLNQTLEEVKTRFDLIFTQTPYKISPDITFLGEIPRKFDFESQATYFKDAEGNDDFVPDDSALAITTSNGLVVISGCAHAGICNIVEYAKQVTQTEKVHAVIGGFHLRLDNNQTAQTISYFKSLSIPNIYPAHCTALPALARFYEAFAIHQVLTGDFFYF
jgi:7,8-dihydropterin-6-yl-methyl-4-(beta-D-ribofuranosyl)aminobenzene 5'-phosphate synthase